MPPKKKVTFANAAGKPLASVRHIERSGRSSKLEPLQRKFVPADLKQIKAKHEASVKRATAYVAAAEKNLSKATKLANDVSGMRYSARVKLSRTDNAASAKKLREQLNKLETVKRNLASKIESLHMNLDMKKSKLKAQKEIGAKKSRFRIVL